MEAASAEKMPLANFIAEKNWRRRRRGYTAIARY